MSISSKTTPFSLELFSFLNSWFIEERLDLGPTTDRQVLKSTGLPSHVPA